MSRPSYFDLVPAQDRQDNATTIGNPDLKAPQSTNIDLRYEMYPSTLDQLGVGLFSKVIIDPIEDQFTTGGVYTTQKGNGNPAKVYGLEFVLAHRFGNVGLTANYTYAYSEATSTKYVVTVDEWGDRIVSTYLQTHPLQSQSGHVGNLILSYENSDWGLGGTISYNYTGRRLYSVSHDDGLDVYQRGAGDIDIALEQKLFPGFKITLKGANLLGSITELDVPPGERTKHDAFVIQREANVLRFTMGVSFKL
jgi:outer membrane receptor for ferrienterochelin and colicin